MARDRPAHEALNLCACDHFAQRCSVTGLSATWVTVHACKGKITASEHRSGRLRCKFHAGDDTGMVRLVGGSTTLWLTPDGAWEYGRLEVLINGFWSIIDEGRFGKDLGRRGALVACR